MVCQTAPNQGSSEIQFTVVIPTYNGEKRLPGVLERLRSQAIPNFLSWEIIIVDNNSQDQTAQVVRAYQQDWPATIPLRYCFEPEQGLAFARQRAVVEARGELVGFLDDDNWPAADWVVKAYEFAQAHPLAGAWGSRIFGEFEVEPPADFRRVATFLALIDRGSKPHYYDPKTKMLPPGAGLVVRKQAWLASVPERLVLNYRSGVKLNSEDLEAGIHLQKAGWELWYNPEMVVHHQIPAWRLERNYLLSLFRCNGLSRHHIRMLRLSLWQKPVATIAYWLLDLYRLAVLQVKYCYKFEQDLVAACHRELLLHALVSPFFLWRHQLMTTRR